MTRDRHDCLRPCWRPIRKRSSALFTAVFGPGLRKNQDSLESDQIRIHIVGFSKLVGDLTMAAGVIAVLRHLGGDCCAVWFSTALVRSTLLLVGTHYRRGLAAGLIGVLGYDRTLSILLLFWIFA